jgi:two-component system, NtrC family, sensor kinase
MEFKFEKVLNLKEFLVNSKSIICFLLDFKGNVLFCNEGYKRILGYSEKNIKDYLINPLFQSLIIHFDDHLIFDGIITFKKRSLNASYVSQIYKCSEGLFFVCEYDSLELETLFNEMSSNTLLINNMNRELIKKEIMLKNTISQLKETQAMLIHSEKMSALGQLVAGMAHEINNPMAYVISNVEMMEQYFYSLKEFIEDSEKENMLNLQSLKEKHDIDYILEDFVALYKATLEGGERIKKIVSELRDYSRIDSSEKNIINVEKCIMSALNIAKPELKEML